MTQREKELLGRIYGCVNRLGTLGPRNPADIAGLARADRLVQQNAKQIAMAISSLGFGDFQDCAETLDDVEAAIGVRR